MAYRYKRSRLIWQKLHISDSGFIQVIKSKSIKHCNGLLSMQTSYSMLICVMSSVIAVARRERKLTQCASNMAPTCCIDDNGHLEVSIIPFRLIVMCVYLCKLNLGESALFIFGNYPLLAKRKTTIQSHHRSWIMYQALPLWSAWAHKSF